ncbi:thioredoxin family protein [Lujinxingia litoralis]|uniref:Thioredoxin family protein n=1 Tax=Lujinxingia litoralis TaxID=2211119 RepID=A0A328C498_9DELT|nr:thioredoxin family protein [Lujinxingia litoralis]RAL20769.1 thioredoxin family protein [Lujinxingia litoralis]
MALLETRAPAPGTPAPDFALPDTQGTLVRRDDFAQAPVLVVMFICNHCPYVQAVLDRLVALGRTWPADQVAFVAISANDAERYPQDGPDAMAELASQYDFPFPYLYDQTQEVARAYGAVCTPDFFVYDQQRTLAYCGRLDDNWKDPAARTRRDLHDAILALLDGERPVEEQHPSMGCSIKWKI